MTLTGGGKFGTRHVPSSKMVVQMLRLEGPSNSKSDPDPVPNGNGRPTLGQLINHKSIAGNWKGRAGLLQVRIKRAWSLLSLGGSLAVSPLCQTAGPN